VTKRKKPIARGHESVVGAATIRHTSDGLKRDGMKDREAGHGVASVEERTLR